MSPKQTHAPAIEERLRDLLRTLDAETQALLAEIEQGRGGTTLVGLWFEYQQFTHALYRRLGGNPRTLRRRLVAYKRQLTKQAHAAASTVRADYPPESAVPRPRWESVRASAALRHDVLKAFAGKLEGLIRPGQARVQTTRTEQKRGVDDA